MLAIACNPIKTVATVDVTVLDQNDKPAANVMVARFSNTSSMYIQNADEKHLTDAGGVAHFELKFLEDLGPEESGEESAVFTFRAFGNDNEPVTEEKRIEVKYGEKATLTLKLNPADEGGDPSDW